MDERDKQLAIIKAYCKGRTCVGCPLYPFECHIMHKWSNLEVYKAYQILFGPEDESISLRLAGLSAKLDVISEKFTELSVKVDAISESFRELKEIT